MPDIDMELLLRAPRRGDSLRARESTARDRVAQIITFGTLKGKQAIKDVGRVLDFPYQDTDPHGPSSIRPPKQGKDFPLARRRWRWKPRPPGVAANAGEARGTNCFDYAPTPGKALLRHAVETRGAGIVIAERPLIESLAALRRQRRARVMNPVPVQ